MIRDDVTIRQAVSLEEVSMLIVDFLQDDPAYRKRNTASSLVMYCRKTDKLFVHITFNNGGWFS